MKFKPNFSNPESLCPDLVQEMDSCKMSLPVPLCKAKFDEPWLYHRDFGVFNVGFGYHTSALHLLRAWSQGFTSTNDDSGYRLYRYDDYMKDAEEFLINTQGLCYESGLGSPKIYVGKRGNIKDSEFDYLVYDAGIAIIYIEDKR